MSEGTWFDDMNERFGDYQSRHVALISVGQQELVLFEDGDAIASYPVSTAVNGIGGEAGSEKTPSGIHYVRTKFGDGAEFGSVFRSRVLTGEVIEPELSPISTATDYVTSRILWLSGLEEGVNQGAGRDSYSRYIYIHGTYEEGLIGQPASHGCIRMLNSDVIDLYDRLPHKALVVITE